MYPSHDKDAYGWALSQVELLKARKFQEADMEHIIEELEDLASSNQRQLASRLEILLAHLLKWQYQPNRQGASWRLTIKEQRRKVKRLLDKNPSLKNCLVETWKDSYEDAVLLAARETGFEEENFPRECPYSFGESIDDNFWPKKELKNLETLTMKDL